MALRGWVLDPHSGGVVIPEQTRRRAIARIEKYAALHHAGKYTRLAFRFRGPLCYVDAFVEPEPPSAALLKQTGESREQFLDRMRALPMRLCRLRHFAEDRRSMAFFTYSNERYEPCVFPTGSFFGMPEEAFALAARYLS
jgi:hypothetical protein